ncbi:AtzE family amidohydrolase [Spirulina subsalsa FACHB-351]|uniref:AtzE family amidohydrolase n=1 Tax=Spirulina subsalsa FACHB-351 TaxID=234711 RepID=A0ABT3L3P7_9CYAN|nr:AtzE family amidohydrolase [Spirulina subsalsa]MCW6036123.1 AtzE family amidohydrolase [Spirulina subsalsa FACHB-351]
MSWTVETADAIAIAHAIRTETVTAETVVRQTLARIECYNERLNCFTQILAQQALADAQEMDRAIAHHIKNIGFLTGVPFGVKNLFNIAGETTLAGSKINASHPPAPTDATAITRLKQAGAVLVGSLNMDEYAYGFVTENHHYGITRNPHDLTRIAGGSSGGAAAAVAAGLLPLALGSDTNGSVRIPAALCGIYGFKPTYGRLSRAGMQLLCSSLDHVGIFARSVRDIASSFDFLQGEDEQDPVCTRHPPEPLMSQINLGCRGLRIAIARDYFQTGADPEALAVVQQVAQALDVTQEVSLPESHRAQAAAFLITAAESANRHLPNLRSRPQDFDPATRDRFFAGTLLPSPWYIQSQRFRRWYRDQMRETFRHLDIILAPTTPCVAPPIGQKTITIAGQETLVRPNLGRFTQPFSFVGLPALSIPIQRPNQLPLGVQLIAAPYNESLILRVAATLERRGVIAAPIAPL